MGSWNSDGTFVYESVSMAALKKALEALENPHLMRALFRLDGTVEQTSRSSNCWRLSAPL
jgi:hypothetical protein